MFEVGKRYKLKEWGPPDVTYICDYVGKQGAAFLTCLHNGTETWALNSDNFEEVKPLTFADLKAGEEFRLQGVKDKAMRIEDGKYVYIEGVFKGQTYNTRFKECCVREHNIVERV